MAAASRRDKASGSCCGLCCKASMAIAVAVVAILSSMGRPEELRVPPDTAVRISDDGWEAVLRASLAEHGFAHVKQLLNSTEAEQLRDIAYNFCYGAERKALPLSWGGYSVPAFLDVPEFAGARWLLKEPRLHNVLKAAFGPGVAYRFASHNDVGCDFVGVWHKDILRGPVKKYQVHDMWTPDESGETHEIYKVIFYLQDHNSDERSMKVIPGSHLLREPALEKGFVTLRPALGDAVIFEQRLTHKGNSFYDPFSPGRIFMQLGFGRDNRFTDEFEQGTQVRQDGYRTKMQASSTPRGYRTVLADVKFTLLSLVTTGIPPDMLEFFVNMDVKRYPRLAALLYGSNSLATPAAKTL